MEFTADTSASSRNYISWYLQYNDGSGYADISGARADTYHRITGNGKDSGTIVYYLHDVGGNDQIRLQAVGDEASVLTTVADGCRVFIERLGGS